MEAGILRELRDAEAFALAAFAGVLLYVVSSSLAVAALAAAGVLVIRVFAGVTLHGTHPPPEDEFPGLTRDQTLVAWYIFRGRADPAISRRTGLSLAKVHELETRIEHRWRVSSREEIAAHVGQLLAEDPRERRQSPELRTLLLDEIAALGVVGVGVATIAVPEETPLIGEVRDPLGLIAVAAGAVIGIIFFAIYLLDRRRH